MNNRIGVFEELRYGIFNTAFANIMNAIKGGCDPIAVTTLVMCIISAFSNIDWIIQNQDRIDENGEFENNKLPPDKEIFVNWLQKWIIDTEINQRCSPEKVYGVRCALIHTAGGSSTLSKSGVKAYQLTINSPNDHYLVKLVDTNRIHINLEDFIAEAMLGIDKFLNATFSTNQFDDLSNFRSYLNATAGQFNGDNTTRFINKLKLDFFDSLVKETPIRLTKENLKVKIRALYSNLA